jgi:4-aminobutyrate aminotransferase/(S)-3-amino-2-methylpropionate transaminase
MSTNSDLLKRRQEAVAPGVACMHSVFSERALGSELWDVEGKRFIDFAGGIAVLNTGHLHPKIKAAAAEQLEKMSHTCFQVTPYESYVAVCERLNELTPGSGPKRRSRSGGERGEDRALRHGPAGRDRLQRRLPRPHDDGHGAHR